MVCSIFSMLLIAPTVVASTQLNSTLFVPNREKTHVLAVLSFPISYSHFNHTRLGHKK